LGVRQHRPCCDAIAMVAIAVWATAFHCLVARPCEYWCLGLGGLVIGGDALRVGALPRAGGYDGACLGCLGHGGQPLGKWQFAAVHVPLLTRAMAAVLQFHLSGGPPCSLALWL
jgi:hypothetical protein